MAFRIFNTLSNFNEELINIIFKELTCFFIVGICDLIFFDINKNETYMLDYSKDEMLVTIIPIFIHILTQINNSSLIINHRMVGLTNKHNLRWFSGK